MINDMEDTRILCFNNYSSLNYWFKDIVQFFRIKNINCKVRILEREIIINNIKLVFIPEYKIEKVRIGRNTSKIFADLENELEKDFIGTLKEILNEKTKRK